jgi:hypothetical protein
MGLGLEVWISRFGSLGLRWVFGFGHMFGFGFWFRVWVCGIVGGSQGHAMRT